MLVTLYFLRRARTHHRWRLSLIVCSPEALEQASRMPGDIHANR
jgi:hypothetical protein